MKHPMKALPFVPSLGSVAIASVCLLAVSPALNAGDRTGNLINEVSQFINKTANGVSQNQPIRAVKSLPGYIIALGNGYAGRGYYYGPPNTTSNAKVFGITRLMRKCHGNIIQTAKAPPASIIVKRIRLARPFNRL